MSLPVPVPVSVRVPEKFKSKSKSKSLSRASSRLRRIALCAACASSLAFGQGTAPQWLNEGWRASKYPQSEWFVGFAQDGLKSGAKESAAIEQVKASARSELSKSVSYRLTAASRNETSSSRVTTGAQSKEIVERNYGQIITTSTGAEVVKTEQYAYHDAQNSRVYAFAAVRKSALADYYANMIESGLSEAERNIGLAKQSAELGKKKDAVEKLSSGRKKIESLGYYRDLLIAVADNGVERGQGDRESRLLKEIAAALADSDGIMPVFVTGTETILSASADIIVPALQTILSDSGCRLAESEKDAGYILRIEARACNAQYDKRFYYSESCVKITLRNVKTGKDEMTVTDFKGPKESGDDAREAAEEAFRAAAPKIWDRIGGKIMANR